MPLITCPDCERRHSDAALACPECARPTEAGMRAQYQAERREVEDRIYAAREPEPADDWTPAKERKKILKWFAWGGVFLFVMFIFGLGAGAEDSSYSANSLGAGMSSAPYSTAPDPTPAVEIEDWNWVADPSFGSNGAIKWNVKLRNNSDQYIDAVRVDFTTYDAAGKMVTTTSNYVRSIPPGGSRADNSYADYYGTEDKAEVQVASVRPAR